MKIIRHKPEDHAAFGKTQMTPVPSLPQSPKKPKRRKR
jgi:hypothetical protein